MSYVDFEKYVMSLVFLFMSFGSIRVPTAQGKQEQWPKKIPVRENTENLEILPKHREFSLLKL